MLTLAFEPLLAGSFNSVIFLIASLSSQMDLGVFISNQRLCFYLDTSNLLSDFESAYVFCAYAFTCFIVRSLKPHFIGSVS